MCNLVHNHQSRQQGCMVKAPNSEYLLDWYDVHARDLPWRISPKSGKAGVKADPYRVWLSEIMLQQTTVASVKSYFEKFLSLWPSVADLAAADLDEVLSAWAGLGYYSRARNLHKCAKIIVLDHNGRFPESAAQLVKLPGIGPYTSGAIAAIAFGEAAPPDQVILLKPLWIWAPPFAVLKSRVVSNALGLIIAAQKQMALKKTSLSKHPKSKSLRAKAQRFYCRTLKMKFG